MLLLPRMTVRIAAIASVVAAAVIAACNSMDVSSPAVQHISASTLAAAPAVVNGSLTMCKSTPAATSTQFEVDATFSGPGVPSQYSGIGMFLSSGGCQSQAGQAGLTEQVSGSENLANIYGYGTAANWSLSSVTIITNTGTTSWPGAGAAETTANTPATSPATCTISPTQGCVLIFNNTPTTPPPPPPPTTCVIPPSGTAIAGSPVSWNGFNAPAGSVVWINAHIHGSHGIPTNAITTVDFTGVTLVVDGVTYAIPNGQIVFNPAASTPTTVVNADGSWTTTVSPTFSDDIFFDGQAVPVDANLENGGHGNTSSTFSFTTNASASGLSFQWQWSAAVYTSWPGNAAANIEPVHANLQAGAPQNGAVQADLIQGPRGGGGSNFTGSWSGTGQGSCPQ